MKKRSILSLILAMVLTISMLLAGCGKQDIAPVSSAKSDEAASPTVEAAKRTITIGASQAGFDVSPFASGSEVRFTTERMLWGLIALGGQLGDNTLDTFQLGVAKSIKTPDDVTVEVELYDYIKDSKGNEIKASDVKFSFDTMIATGVLPAVANAIESIDVTGEYTVTLHFTDNSVGKKEQCLARVPIISQKWYESASEEERSTDPATTGPYRVKTFETGSRLVLEKVENYWQTDASLIPTQQQSNFDEITFAVISEGTQRSIALENGEIDVAPIDAQGISRFMNEDGTAAKGWTVSRRSAIGGYYMFLNMAEGSLLQSTPKLREAICYAIDSESVRLGAGETKTSGAVLNSYGTPALKGYNEDFVFYGQNLDHAREAFGEAGCEKGLKLKVLYSQGGTAAKGMPVIQANLAEIGIDLELIGVDQALFNSYKNEPRQWDLMVDYKGAGNGFVSYMFTSAFDNRGRAWGTNFTTDKTLEELAIKASTEFSQENCDAFQQELKSQYQVVPLYYGYSYMVAQDGILDIVLSSDNYVSPNCFKVADDYQSVVK